ncbi:hypothetical protein CPB84DRAFT_1683338 [Gymnopilus junonius]|uniref:Uncharacterized protein n=1 Tax=Gymnopilus junonius TaxID=109634 RepID=A0A9P5NLS0_GYMJU|nr:hypothetical protein CPB84DRAFT_1683338 [Gymnopilus junonius]
MTQSITNGGYSALLVQPEQLFMNNGHMPSTGLEHYDLPAFHPAWGRLGEFRIKLGKNVVVQALSGMQPEHIKKAIIKCLLFDKSKLYSIKLSSNRPNITYATHQIVNKLSDIQNLNFLIPTPYPTDFHLPKTLIFHDNSDEANVRS